MHTTPSSGVRTMGSTLLLNEVFSSTGTPVSAPKRSRSRHSGWFCSRVTVCTRALPSTWVTAPSRDR